MRQTPELGRQLRQILVERFEESTLKDLCFDLGVDYESLSGEGKANKARELVASCIRSDSLTELIEVGKALRPDITWPTLAPAPLQQAGMTIPCAWILVTGTGSSAPLAAKVGATAERLGQLLATHAYGLVTGGWPGVDEQVARSFNEESSVRGLPVEDHLIQVLERGRVPAFAAGDLRIVKARGFGEIDAWTTKALEAAHVVIVVEGAGGARRIAKVALKNRMIVLPLADTGGDAKKQYWDMLTSWDKTQTLMPEISKKSFAVAAREAPAVVEDIIELLNKLYPIAPALGSAS